MDSSNTVAISSGGPVSGPSNSSKTAHTKVATSGGHANTQAPSKRTSSGADGDYQLVQHEVLYSLSAEYEVRFFVFFFFPIMYNVHYKISISIRDLKLNIKYPMRLFGEFIISAWANHSKSSALTRNE